MKVLVVYSSVTGNTEKVARAIASAFEGAVVAKASDMPITEGYDLVFAGFWCDKGQVDDKCAAFLAAMPARPVCVFGTLGGDPKSERAAAFIEKVAGKIPEHLELKALRMWQGKIDPKIIEAMSRMPGASPMTEERKARLAEAAKHPTEGDLAEARAWAKECAAAAL
jgi:flavodoxin